MLFVRSGSVIVGSPVSMASVFNKISSSAALTSARASIAPRQWCAPTAAERLVGIGITANVEAVRILEDILVAIGRTQHRHHACALGDKRVAEHDVWVAPRTQNMIGVEYRITSSTAVLRASGSDR